MDAEELTHATGKAVCVKRDNSSSDLAQGVASLWRTAAGEHLITCGEGFVMPLVGQPVLRVSRGVFVFACPPEGEVKNYVLLLRAERVGDEEAIDLFEATLAATTTVRSATGQGASAAAGGGGGGGGGGAAAAPAPAHAIVPAPAAAAPAGAAAAAGAGAGALSLAALRAQLPPAEVVGSTLSRGITSLGMGVKSALVAGATLTGMGVAAASKAIGQAVGPSAAPLKLSDTTVARMQQARVVTRSAAVLTGAMVEGAAVMARSMGAAAAAAMAESNTGKRLIAQSATPTGVAVKQVGSASLQAIKTVWDGMEEAAYIVGHASAGATRDFMHQRYGASGDAPTEAALALAGDVGVVAMHARNLGVGGLVSKAVCETAGASLALANGGGAGAQPQQQQQQQRLLMGGAGAGAAGGGGLGGGLGLAMAVAATPGAAALAGSNPSLANAAMAHAMAHPELAVQAMQYAAANPQAAQAALQLAGNLAAAGAPRKQL